MAISAASFPRKLVLLFLVGLPLGLFGGETGFRLYLASQGETYDGGQVRIELRELRSRLLDPMPRPGVEQQKIARVKSRTKIIHPFLGHDNLGSFEQFNRDLRQSTESDDEHLRVVILGGSVAGLFGGQGAKRLTALIKEVPGYGDKDVEFMGYGRGGHKQPQQLIRLMHLLVSGIRPDMVISIDGFNEVALGNKNHAEGMNPTYPSFPHWMRFARSLGESEEQHAKALRVERKRASLLETIDGALANKFLWSAIAGHAVMAKVHGEQGAYGTTREAYMETLKGDNLAPGVLGPGFKGTSKEALESCVSLWQESSRQIQNLCDMYGMKYLHVLQPTLYDPGAKPMTPEEIKKGTISPRWKEGVLLGYPMLRARGQELADEGIAFMDASMVFANVKQTLYYDSCHFNTLGNQLLAEAIFARLVDWL